MGRHDARPVQLARPFPRSHRRPVGALDRSNSRDWSRDRTGDHDTPDVSSSRDLSQDATSDAGAPDTDTKDDTGDTKDAVPATNGTSAPAVAL